MAGDQAAAIEMVANAIRNSRPVIVPPPPVFDGSDGSYAIEDFFTLYEAYATSVYGPVSRSWILGLQTYLAGEPRQVLMAIGTSVTDYGDVKERVKACCKSAQGVSSPHHRFLQATRLPGESLHVFAVRLRRLAAQAFGQVNDVDAVIMPKFMLSLTDEVRQAVETHLLAIANPTLEHVLQFAVSISNRHAGPQLDTVKLLEAPTPPPLQRASAAGFSSPRAQGVKCYGCGEVGHYASRCPSSGRGLQSGPQQGRGGNTYSRGRGGFRGRGRGRANPEFNICAFCGFYGHFMTDCTGYRQSREPNSQRPGN